MKRSRVGSILLVFALFLINGLWIAMPCGSYKEIVIHHSAGSGDFHTIRRAHRARGWFEIAYHFVLSDGSTEVASGHLEPTWRYRLGLWSTASQSRQHNLSAIHLCLVGNYEETEVRTSLQNDLGHAVSALQKRHGISDKRVLLHRDCGPTACPGQSITRPRVMEWAARANTSPVETRQQHLRAIRSGRLASGLYLFGGLVCNLLLIRHRIGKRGVQLRP